MNSVNRQDQNQVSGRSDAEVMMLTQKELVEIVTVAVNAALNAREEARPATASQFPSHHASGTAGKHSIEPQDYIHPSSGWFLFSRGLK